MNYELRITNYGLRVMGYVPQKQIAGNGLRV